MQHKKKDKKEMSNSSPFFVGCIGSATYDIILQTDNPITPNRKQPCQQTIKIGGGAANAAQYYTRQPDIQPYIISTVGNDAAGHYIKNNLTSQHINTSLLHTASCATRTSYIINEPQSSILTYTDPTYQVYMPKTSFVWHALHISSLPKTSWAEVVPYIQKHIHTLTLWNPGIQEIKNFKNQHIQSILQASDIFVCNQHEALQLAETLKTKPFSFAFFSKLSQQEPRHIIITNGSHDLIYFDGSIIHSIPVPQIKQAITTRGAGDALCARLMHAFLQQHAPIDAIQTALHHSAAYISL